MVANRVSWSAPRLRIAGGNRIQATDELRIRMSRHNIPSAGILWAPEFTICNVSIGSPEWIDAMGKEFDPHGCAGAEQAVLHCVIRDQDGAQIRLDGVIGGGAEI